MPIETGRQHMQARLCHKRLAERGSAGAVLFAGIVGAIDAERLKRMVRAGVRRQPIALWSDDTSAEAAREALPTVIAYATGFRDSPNLPNDLREVWSEILIAIVEDRDRREATARQLAGLRA